MSDSRVGTVPFILACAFYKPKSTLPPLLLGCSTPSSHLSDPCTHSKGRNRIFLKAKSLDPKRLPHSLILLPLAISLSSSFLSFRRKIISWPHKVVMGIKEEVFKKYFVNSNVKCLLSLFPNPLSCINPLYLPQLLLASFIQILLQSVLT